MTKSCTYRLALLAAFTFSAFAQSLTTGGISGTVTDPTGAVVPAVSMTLTNLGTGGTQATTTGQAGEYRFALLPPGHYSVAASQPGFQRIERPVDVVVGELANLNLTLQVGQATQTVEVTETAPLISTEPSQTTSFTTQQIELLPSAGGDITNIAFTAPGVGSQRHRRVWQLHGQRLAGHLEPVHGQRRERHGPVF